MSATQRCNGTNANAYGHDTASLRGGVRARKGGAGFTTLKLLLGEKKHAFPQAQQLGPDCRSPP